MKLAFCLFEYFPYGGLQRDCIRIVKACVENGMDVTIFTREWEGPRPAGIQIVELPTWGWSNAGKVKRFVKAFHQAVAKEKYDGVIGFNKMPGLDVYFAADPCFVEKAERKYPFWYRWLLNYRTYASHEKAVFGANSKTHILLLNEAEKSKFQQHYHTPEDRFHALPPGIQTDRCAPIDYTEKRALLREGFSLNPNEKLILFIGSAFATKGLDRAIEAMGELSSDVLKNTQMWVVGTGDPIPYEKMIEANGLDDKVFFLGGRDDIPELLWTANVLLHPAYSENAGMVILEAMVAGLPVLTTDVCGYAHYVNEAKAGIVLPSPFNVKACTTALNTLLKSTDPWHKNAIEFALKTDLYSMVESAQNTIEMVMQNKHD